MNMYTTLRRFPWIFCVYFSVAKSLVVQNSSTFNNLDFFVNLRAYQINGTLQIATFSYGCKPDISTLSAGGMNVVFFSNITDAGCDLQTQAFVNMIDSVGSNTALFPQLILFVDIPNSSNNFFELLPKMQASNIIFTSVSYDTWLQLNIEEPLVITTALNPVQTFLLSSSSYAYLVVLSVIWGILAFFFFCATINTVILLRTKLAWNLRASLSVLGFVFSTFIFGSYAARASLLRQSTVLNVVTILGIYLFTMVPQTIGVVLVIITWLKICRETRQLPDQLAVVVSIGVTITGVLFLLLLVILGGVWVSLQWPFKFFLAVTIIGIATAILILICISLIIFCFVRLWITLSKVNRSKSKSQGVRKLASVSLGSALTLLLVFIIIIAQDLSVITTASYAALDCLRALAAFPMMASWLSLSNLWNHVVGLSTTDPEKEQKTHSKTALADTEQPKSTENV